MKGLYPKVVNYENPNVLDVMSNQTFCPLFGGCWEAPVILCSPADPPDETFSLFSSSASNASCFCFFFFSSLAAETESNHDRWIHILASHCFPFSEAARYLLCLAVMCFFPCESPSTWRETGESTMFSVSTASEAPGSRYLPEWPLQSWKQRSEFSCTDTRTIWWENADWCEFVKEGVRQSPAGL